MRYLFLLVLMVIVSSSVLAQTNAPKNDRIVGQWRSSSGATFTLAYSGRPENFLVMLHRGALDSVTYTATWNQGDRFSYATKDDTISGSYDPARDTFEVHNTAGTWKSTWTRQR